MPEIEMSTYSGNANTTGGHSGGNQQKGGSFLKIACCACCCVVLIAGFVIWYYLSPLQDIEVEFKGMTAKSDNGKPALEFGGAPKTDGVGMDYTLKGRLIAELLLKNPNDRPSEVNLESFKMDIHFDGQSPLVIGEDAEPNGEARPLLSKAEVTEKLKIEPNNKPAKLVAEMPFQLPSADDSITWDQESQVKMLHACAQHNKLPLWVKMHDTEAGLGGVTMKFPELEFAAEPACTDIVPKSGGGLVPPTDGDDGKSDTDGGDSTLPDGSSIPGMDDDDGEPPMVI